MSDSLLPRGLQHPRLTCPSPTPGAYSNSCPLSRWCQPTISSSVVPFSSRLQSFPASGSFPMSQFFTSCSQSIAVSVSATVLPMNIQDWFPLGLTGWIALQSKGLSRVFSILKPGLKKHLSEGKKEAFVSTALSPVSSISYSCSGLSVLNQFIWFIWGSGLCFTRIKDSSWAKEKPQKDGRRGKFTFRIKPHSLQRCSEGSNTTCAHQDPGTPQRPRQNFVWEPPVEVQVSRGLPQGQGLWVQQTWVWHKPSWRKSPLNPPKSCQNLHRTGKKTLGGHKQGTSGPRKKKWHHKTLSQTCWGVSSSLRQRCGLVVACCWVGGQRV